MTKPIRLIVGLIITGALSAPPLAYAQAVPRGSGGSGSSGGGSGSSGGGGESSPPPAPAPPVRNSPPPAPPGGARSGAVTPRTGTSGVQPSGNPNGRPVGTSNDPRDRGARLAAGSAIPRQNLGTGGGGTTVVGPWGRWYPWYGSGLNWNYGFIGYNPFYAGYTDWTWGRYGLWYNPYHPFGGYDPYVDSWLYASAYGYGGGGGESSYRSERQPHESTGSVRLRIKPGNAKVYLDGTLLGTVDDFDGLSSHLAASAGRHEIQIRADGYQPLTLSVNVEEDRTVTARGTLKKN